MQYRVNCKIVTISFCLLIIQLTVYNRTVTRFIAVDKVVCQRVRWEIWLASDNSWARRHLKHLSWRSQWNILCRLEQRMAFWCKISRADRCLFGLCSWLSTRSSTAVWGTLSTTAAIVPVLQILFCRLLMLPSFQPLSGSSFNSLCAPYCFERQIF